MNVDKKLAVDALSHGHLWGFIPYPLDVPDRPELSVFPLNVAFAKYKVENNRMISGSALYLPEFDTFALSGSTVSMRYRNGYGGESSLVIEYDIDKGSYTGSKFVHGKLVVEATGPEWNWFFVHFTILGLSNGERCMFDPPRELPLPPEPEGV
jgi:hypothetical protein